ncbi:MAG TPA: hypothetical protein VGF89_08495 [Steroidobacteraceae bacterium]
MATGGHIPKQLSDGRLTVKADIQHIGAFMRRELAHELKGSAAPDPAGRSDDRVPHDLAGDGVQQAAGHDAILCQGRLELPARLPGPLQAQQRQSDQGSNAGIGCEFNGPLQQAQRGIVVAPFEGQQVTVDRSQRRCIIVEASPRPVHSA